MTQIKMKRNTTKDIHREFKRLYQAGQFQSHSSGPTLEIIGASFLADKPAIFGTPDVGYISREIEWYKSQSLNVNDIPGGTPKIWQQVSAKAPGHEGQINSNYGHLVLSKQNGSQYDNVLDTLKKRPHSRQATMIYTRPTMHQEYNKWGMYDFICTNSVTYFLRKPTEELGFQSWETDSSSNIQSICAVVQMRSNDAYYGYRNDYAWQRLVQTKLVEDLRDHYNKQGVHLTVGTIEWQVQNLHVYSRHFNLLMQENIEGEDNDFENEGDVVEC
jgi:thymidylate synthase